MAAHSPQHFAKRNATCHRRLWSNWPRVVHKTGDWVGKGRINHSETEGRPMRCQSIRRLFSSVALGMFACLGTAQADLIDFETLPPDSLFASGATFNQATYYQFTQNGDFSLVSTAASFVAALPPSGNDTQFHAPLNH